MDGPAASAGAEHDMRGTAAREFDAEQVAEDAAHFAMSQTGVLVEFDDRSLGIGAQLQGGRAEDVGSLQPMSSPGGGADSRHARMWTLNCRWIGLRGISTRSRCLMSVSLSQLVTSWGSVSSPATSRANRELIASMPRTTDFSCGSN